MDLMYAIINMGGMYICFACCMIVAAQRPSYGQKCRSGGYEIYLY